MDWSQYVSGITIVGIPALAVVIAVVALLKQMGLPTSFTGVAAALAGIGVAFLVQAVTVWPVITPWVTAVVMGILLGLAGNGLYSQYQHITETRAKDAANKDNPLA